MHVVMQPGHSFFNCIVRLDIKSGENQIWEEEGTYPGEPIFVPRPGGSEEDDGVLLSVVFAGQKCSSCTESSLLDFFEYQSAGPIQLLHLLLLVHGMANQHWPNLPSL